MKSYLLLKAVGVASPVAFVLVVGGAIALADYWMRRQPRPAKPRHREKTFSAHAYAFRAQPA